RKAQVVVDHHAFLDVGAGTEHDRLVVAAQHGAEPDTDILADMDIADDRRVGCDPVAVRSGELRFELAEGIKGHGSSRMRGPRPAVSIPRPILAPFPERWKP